MLKKFKRELTHLQDTAIAFAGGKHFDNRQADLMDNIQLLLPEETKKQKGKEHVSAWARLKIMGKRRK